MANHEVVDLIIETTADMFTYLLPVLGVLTGLIFITSLLYSYTLGAVKKINWYARRYNLYSKNQRCFGYRYCHFTSNIFRQFSEVWLMFFCGLILGYALHALKEFIISLNLLDDFYKRKDSKNGTN